jgi:hypothetical protein
MNDYRGNAVAAGGLFIVATVASLIGNAMVKPILTDPDYLAKIAGNETRMFLGALLKFISALTSAGIALALYPVVRRYSGSLAIGSVALRLGEGMFYAIGAIGVLLLVSLGHEAAGAGAMDAAGFRHAGAMLMAASDSAGFVAGVLFFGLGGLMYYWVFFQAALLPRWLSAWGIVGVALSIVAAVLVLFQVTVPMSTAHILLNLPIGVQEMVFAVWLIARGFDPRAIAAGQVAVASPAVVAAAS